VDRRLIVHFAFVAAVAVGASSCSSTGFSFSRTSDNGLTNVDELLTRIEKVQVESVVSKERARAAYDTLVASVSPEFSGSAVTQYAELEKSIEVSQKQAKSLAETIPALKASAAGVFERWTRDLESFGNTRMRQRSQERMEATREHYELILRQALASQVSFEALNADLKDHALFLENDFNAESAAMIFDDVTALETRVAELDGRLDAAIQSSKRYIASRALRGEVELAEEQPVQPKAGKGQRRRAKQPTAEQAPLSSAPVSPKLAAADDADGTD